MKVLTIGARAELCEGRLAGTKGKIVAYDAVRNEVLLEVDEQIYISCPSEFIEEITYKKLVKKEAPPKENRPKGFIVTENFKNK